jgi:cell filamentation protein
VSEPDDSFRAVGRSARDLRAHGRHFYPNTDVLKNLADIRDAATLEQFERMQVAIASRRRAPMRSMSYPEFNAIHRHVFREVYPWAGDVRDYTTGRAEAPFCLPEFIDAQMTRIFAELNAANNLQGISREEFADRAAAVINDINAVHPFIEGNGRVSREFLKDLAAQAGHPVDLARLNRETWYPAAAVGFAQADNAPMAACIRAALQPGPADDAT